MNRFFNKMKLKKLLSKTDKKILFVGIGNAIKSDDGIGIYICKNIKTKNNIRTLIVESGIEKYVGKINSMDPGILILVDCTDFNKQPGFYDLISVNDIRDHTFNTHTISVKRISEFFKMEKYLLGIQPENVKFGEQISEKVKQSADQLIQYINRS